MDKERIFYVLAAIVLFLGTNYSFAQNNNQRDQIDEKYKWDLSDLYETNNDWQEDINWIKRKLDGYIDFKSKLNTSADILYDGLKYDEKIKSRLERVYLYAKLSKDINMKSPENISNWSKYISLHSDVNLASAFIDRELITISSEKITEFTQSKPELSVYNHYINNLKRKATHTLDDKSEDILDSFTPIVENPFNLYSSLYMDIEFPVVENEKGESIPADRSLSWSSRRSDDRRFRKVVHSVYFNTMGKYKQTFTNNVNNYVNARIIQAKVRGYETALAASFNENNLPVEIYDNLIENVTSNVQPLQRWMKIKKEFFNLDTLYFYDTEVSMFPESDREYTFDEAMVLLEKSLQPLGKDYVDEIKNAYKNQWIDVFPYEGKENAGYSSGPNYPNAWVKLNWSGTLTDFFTLVHELGHYVHAAKVIKNQPYVYKDYPPFLAEIASTTAENISFNYLIDNAKTKEEKLYFMEQYLNNTTMMLYLTTMMADLEKIIYSSAENGEPKNSDEICNKFMELNKKYYGNTVQFKEADKYRWISWAHYYLSYYVYSYATSYATSTYFAEMINSGEKEELDNFINLLEKGTSVYPFELLKNSGVDLTTPKPYAAVFTRMDRFMDEIEAQLKDN